MTRTLVVRLDATGDVLLAGPAVRAVAAGSSHVTLLCGPRGAEAGRLLPGVDEVLVWECPWIEPDPRPVTTAEVDGLADDLGHRGFERALVLTSFHQSPLPTALVLRLAGVPWVGAISEDYPGSLLDLRHLVPDSIHEAERALSLVRAAGFTLPPGDDGSLAVRHPLPDTGHLLGTPNPVVLHPGTSVPARAWPVERYADLARLLTDRGHDVVVTGGPSERMLTRSVVGDTSARDLGGRTSLPELAAVLASASVVVVGNTGPAHLAAAVGSPVVSLFAPTVPAVRWAPYRVPSVLLGDQHGPCRATRVTQCPFPGHPCLTSVTTDEVLRAVEQLCGPKQPTVVGSSTRSTA